MPDIAAECGRYSRTVRVTSHTARNTIAYLRRENITFIEPEMSPRNRRDLIPIDYAIWRALQVRVYHDRKFKTVDQLKQTCVLEWCRLPQRFINNID